MKSDVTISRRGAERRLLSNAGLLGGETTIFKDVVANVTVWIAAFFFAAPLIYAFFSSLKHKDEIYAVPPTLFGAKLRWSNYIEVFTYGPFVRYLLHRCHSWNDRCPHRLDHRRIRLLTPALART